MDKEVVSMLWDQYSGRIICTFLAVFLGIVYLKFGFWKMLFFLFLVISGYFVGQYIDRKAGWKEAIDKIFLKRWADKS